MNLQYKVLNLFSLNMQESCASFDLRKKKAKYNIHKRSAFHIFIFQDLPLLQRRALLRRKYGGDRGTRERARAWRAGAVVAAARGDDEQ